MNLNFISKCAFVLITCLSITDFSFAAEIKPFVPAGDGVVCLKTIVVLPPFFVFTGLMFFIAAIGFVFNRSHFILTLVSAELMLLASFLNFAYASVLHGSVIGWVYCLVILVLAAAESAIGLSYVIALHRAGRDAELNAIPLLIG